MCSVPSNVRPYQHLTRHTSNMCSAVSATGLQVDGGQHVLHEGRYGLLSFWWRQVSRAAGDAHE